MIGPAISTKRATPKIASGGRRISGGLGITDQNAPTADQQRQAYRGLLYRLLKLRADAISKALMEARVQRKTGQNEYEDVEEGHPWVQLLEKPSSNYNPKQIYQWLSLARDTSNGAFFIVSRGNRGVPDELLPIFPYFGRMEPSPSDTGGISSFTYHKRGGGREVLPFEDVVWLRHQHPVSPYESASLLEAAAYEADIDLYMHVYRRDSLKRGNHPPAYLSSDQNLTEQQASRWGQSFEENYTQIGQAGKTPVFGQGLSLETVGLSPKDLEFVEGSGLNDQELMDIAGVPQAMLRTESSNRSVAEAARRTFYQNTVQAEADAAAAQLTHDFQEAFGADEGLRIVVPDVVPLDPSFELKRDEKRLQNGMITLNEWRAANGRDPYEDEAADEPLVSGGLLPLSDLSFSEPSAAAEQDEVGGEDRMVRSARMVRSEDELAIQWRAIDRKRQGLERTTEAAMRELFRRQEEAVVQALEAKRMIRESLEVSELFDFGEWLQETLGEIRPRTLDILRNGFRNGQLQAEVEGLAFNSEAPVVRKMINWTNQNSRLITATTSEKIGREVQQGLINNETITQITRRMKDNVFEEAKGPRARMIAQTTTTSGFEAGQLQAWTDAGIKSKRWLSQRDGRVRETHMVADGQEVPIMQPFEVRGEYLMHPGDPNGSAGNVIQCRCSMLPILSD